MHNIISIYATVMREETHLPDLHPICFETHLFQAYCEVLPL